MKKNCSLFFVLMGVFALSLEAQVDSGTRVYGYQMGDKNGNFGFVSFTVDDWTNVKMEKKISVSEPQICAAEYFDGKLYAYLVESDDYGGLYPSSYTIYDADNYNMLAEKEAIPYFMHDMAYDYTTNTMYGLVELEENTERLEKANLCIIDMETGRYKVIGDVGKSLEGGALVTLACNSAGELYAMSEYRCFYKIDKNTGVATQLGEQHKLAVINSFQTMAFDTSDHLYWAQQTPDYGWFTTIDYTTGVPTKQGTLGADAQITGLYFKRTVNKNLPEKVSSLQATVNPAEPYKVKLTWTNPSKTFGGDVLGSLEGIRIYRVGTSDMIADVKTTVGVNAEYIDEINISGNQLYKLIPYNKDGIGFPAFAEAFSGYDQPKAVNELKIIQNEQTISLTWKAPTESVNGGFVDYEHLTYNIYRVQGTVEQLISEKQSELSFTETLTKLGGYTYKVTAMAGDVEGLSTTSDKILIQGIATIPYSTGFESTDDVDFWKKINHNDSYGWSIATGYGALSGAFAQCKTGGSSAGAADDWLISPAIHMEKGLYLLKYSATAGYSRHDYSVAIGLTDNPESFTKVLQEFNDYDVSSWEEISISIQIDEPGDYYVAWHATTVDTYATLKIDNISIQFTPEYDAAVTSVYVPLPTDKLDVHSPVTVVVENKGLKAFDKFKITAQTSYKTQPAEEVEYTVEPGGTYQYQLKNGVDFSEFGLHAVRVWVDLVGDVVQGNDTTQIAFTYHVKPADIPFEVGFEKDETEDLFGWNTSNDVTVDNQGWIVPVAEVAHTGSQSMGYKASTVNPANHWVYSKALNLKSRQSYKLTYYVLNLDNDKTNKWKVAIGTEQNPESMTENIGEKEYNGAGKQWEEITQIFTPKKDAVYYMGWHITSAADMGGFCIDDVHITEISPKDIAIDKAIAVTPLNALTAIKVFIRNNGTEPIDSYVLSYQINGGDIVSEKITAKIEPLASVEYVFNKKMDMSAFGKYKIVVKADLTGDANLDNNAYTFIAVRSGDNDLDFENCNDFENKTFVTSQNKIWTSMDGDEGVPYRIGSYTYPHIGEPTALLAFNPDMTTPALTESKSFGVSEQGGKRYGLFMSVNYNACDDWLISPKMKVLTEDAAFSMLARDVRSTSSDIADFYIEIATTDGQPTVNDFVKLTPDICHVTTQWETYSYPLKDYVGRDVWIAVHHVSNMKYALLVDNLAFSGCEGSITTSNQKVEAMKLIIQPNPSDGYFEIISEIPVVSYHIYDMQGRLLRTECAVYDTNISVDITSLSQGLYQVCVIDEKDNCHTVKLMRK